MSVINKCVAPNLRGHVVSAIHEYTKEKDKALEYFKSINIGPFQAEFEQIWIKRDSPSNPSPPVTPGPQSAGYADPTPPLCSPSRHDQSE